MNQFVKIICLLFNGSFLLAGCVLSIEPVVPESTAIFDSRLLGNWESAEGLESAVVIPKNNAGYEIAYTGSDGKTGRFDARLGRLNNHLILDIWPADREPLLSEPVSGLLLKGHMTFVLELAPDSLLVGELNADSLLTALNNNDVPLSYTFQDDRLVLLDSTETMRRTLASYLDRNNVVDSYKWVRSEEQLLPVTQATNRYACFEAAAWREADHLFRSDPYWIGADDAYSIDLGQDRTLWLFGDTWIDSSGLHSRDAAHMIRNSIAIQTGSNPAQAGITFYWRKTGSGEPSAFFENNNNEWFWPGHGIRLGDRLLLFLMKIRSSKQGLGFESAGWNAVMVSNPDESPSVWHMRRLETPENILGVVVGSAGVLRWADYVYAFSSQESVKSHPMYLVRWPVEAALQGDLRSPEWWAGADTGWTPDTSMAVRWPAFENGQTELTVHYDSVIQQFVAVQHVGFGPADLTLRVAPDLTGPWSEPRMIYRPAEYYRPNIMIYAAKAHPQLDGADLVLTYATNSFQFSDHLSDSLIYYPRFVRLTRCQ